MITLLPVLYARSARSDKIFAISAWISFALSFLAFLFMIGIWGVAKSRFEKRGFDASYGNLVCFSQVFLGLHVRCACVHNFLLSSPGCPSLRCYCYSSLLSVHTSLDLYRKKKLTPVMLATDIKPIWRPVGRLDQSTTLQPKKTKLESLS